MKKKYFISWIIILLTIFTVKSQTVLTAGDIAITGFNADDPDRFTFVILTDITATTQINFTDRGWFATGGFRGFEGTITWTTDRDLLCGTEVIITNNSPFSTSIGTVTDSGGLGLATVGDQILAYQGPDATPTFINAINFDGAGWSDAINANTTALPTGLTDGVNAVDFGEIDNASYDCSVSNDPVLILTAVSNDTNWTLSNVIIPIGGCYYTCCISTTIWNGVVPGWDNGLPTTTSEAVINALYDTGVSGSIDACSLTVNADLTIAGSSGK